MTQYTKLLFILLAMATFCFAGRANAVAPIEPSKAQMENILAPLSTSDGWKSFAAQHSDCMGEVNGKTSIASVGVSDLTLTIDGKEYKVGLGCRGVFIEASPKTVVGIVDSPRFFQALYGLDKPADIYPVNADGSFNAHIFKLVPGIETQDYTLNYTPRWSGDSWIVHTKLVRDERSFAVRATSQIVEPAPDGHGSIYREVGLFLPLRWWMNLVHGVVQSVTKRELAKLNWSVKCAAEKVERGTMLTAEIARACQKEAQER